MPFPLAALEHWYNVLAPRGTLLLRVPDKKYTFDVGRARTPLAHLVEEKAHPERFDKRAHFRDFLQGVSDHPETAPEFQNELKHLLDIDYSIHFHVWTMADLEEMLEYTSTHLGLDWSTQILWPARFFRKEVIILLRKGMSSTRNQPIS